jgi:replicative DNA helicase
LRESGSIEQDADVVMFLYREDYYDPETERQHITDLFIKKHRNGPIGQVELFFVAEQTRFRSVDKRREE